MHNFAHLDFKYNLVLLKSADPVLSFHADNDIRRGAMHIGRHAPTSAKDVRSGSYKSFITARPYVCIVLVVHQLMDLHLSPMAPALAWKRVPRNTDHTRCHFLAAMNYVASVQDSFSQLLPSPALASRAPSRWPYPGPCCPPSLIGRSELSHWWTCLTLSATGTRDSSATL